MTLFLNDIFFFIPEFLYITLLSLLIVLAIYNKNYLSNNELVQSLTDLSIISLTFIAIAYSTKYFNSILISNFLIKEDLFSITIKLIIIVLSIVIFILSKYYYATRNIISFEIPLIMVFAIFGIITVVSSNDLFLIYLALEMQSLSIYALVSSKTSSNISAEAGLKYFILGSFISGFILYGISLIYLIAGSTNLNTLNLLLLNTDNFVGKNILILGILLVTIGLLFKLSAAPLHNWTPDVFDGSPTIITTFLSTIPKIAVVYLFVNILHNNFYTLEINWSQVLLCSGFLSMIVGCFGGLYQTKLKRLLAYSTINNMGFILLNLGVNTWESIEIAIFYIITYVILSIGVFSIIILFVKTKNSKETVYIRDLAELQVVSPVITMILAFNVFSLIGIPPFAGFVTKFFTLMGLINSGFYGLSILALLLSVITSFYYIRLVKIMFFNKEVWNNVYFEFKESILFIIYCIMLFNVFLLANVEFVLKLINVILPI